MLALSLLLLFVVPTCSTKAGNYTSARLAHHHVLLDFGGSQLCIGIIYRMQVISAASSSCAELWPSVRYVPWNAAIHRNLLSHEYTHRVFKMNVQKDYKKATGPNISQHDIAVFEIRGAVEFYHPGPVPFNFSQPVLFGGIFYRTDIIDMVWFETHPNAMARITYGKSIPPDLI